MKCIYAPWRSHYTESTEQTKELKAEECFFCVYLQQNEDEKNFILRRFAHTAVIFNRYPYNAGHLLVIPLEHIGHLEHLSSQARAELMEVTTAATTILQKTARPNGFNVGLNLGKAAGASIPTHLHMHVLPRWAGDTNFMPTLGETKVISFDLHKIYADLKPHFDELKI